MKRHASVTTQETITELVHFLNASYVDGDTPSVKGTLHTLKTFNAVPEFDGETFSVTKETLQQFDTAKEAAARDNLKLLNETERALITARAQRSIEIHTKSIERYKTWFVENGFEITNASLTTGHQAPSWTLPYEKDLELEAEERKYYLAKEINELEDDRKQLIRHLETEMTGLQEMLETAKKGDWGRLYFSHIRGSNHSDLLDIAARIESRTQFLRNMKLIPRGR